MAQQQGKAVGRLDATQALAATRILDVSDRAPHDASRELLGMVHPQYKRQKVVACYKRHVDAQSPNSLLRRVYYAKDGGSRRPVMRPLRVAARRTIESLELDCNQPIDTFKESARAAAAKASRKAYATGVRTQPQAELLGATHPEVLEGVAPYLQARLDGHLSAGRAAKTRMLLGVSDLEVDVGRRANVLHDQRKCRYCSSGKVDDPRHFLLDCRANAARNATFRQAVAKHDENNDALFKRLMSPAFGYDDADEAGSAAQGACLYRHIAAIAAARREPRAA